MTDETVEEVLQESEKKISKLLSDSANSSCPANAATSNSRK